MKELDSVLNTEFNKNMDKIKEIQKNNISKIAELHEFMKVKVEPEADEEHEFKERDIINSKLNELESKATDTS